MHDEVDQLEFDGVPHRIRESHIAGGIIVRRNGYESVSFRFYADTNHEYFAEAAGLPLEIRSWKELDGLTIKHKGNTPGDAYYFFDGSEHFGVLSNTWSFQRLRANRFHVAWNGEWEYIPGRRKSRQPFKLSAEAAFTGIHVSGWEKGIFDPIGVKSVDEARRLIAKHLVAEDFELEPVPTGPTDADYWFPVRVD